MNSSFCRRHVYNNPLNKLQTTEFSFFCNQKLISEHIKNWQITLHNSHWGFLRLHFFNSDTKYYFCISLSDFITNHLWFIQSWTERRLLLFLCLLSSSTGPVAQGLLVCSCRGREEYFSFPPHTQPFVAALEIQFTNLLVTRLLALALLKHFITAVYCKNVCEGSFWIGSQ